MLQKKSFVLHKSEKKTVRNLTLLYHYCYMALKMIQSILTCIDDNLDPVGSSSFWAPGSGSG